MATKSVRPRYDPRFALYQCQPRGNKLDKRQREICCINPAYLEALRNRVANAHRFSAFIEGIPLYIDLERPCPKCGGFRRRVRDRSCYQCHLARGGENFERIKAGIDINRKRNRDSYLDLVSREKAERRGECIEKQFGGFILQRWPTGRLTVMYPTGQLEPDFAACGGRYVWDQRNRYPDLNDGLVWAGWT